MCRSTDADSAVQKLRSRAGESIAEVLIALLISALALTILASMITASKNALERSKKKMDDYNSKNARLVNQSNNDGSGSVNIKINGAGGVSSIWDFTGKNATASVYYYVNPEFSSNPVVAYAPYVS